MPQCHACKSGEVDCSAKIILIMMKNNFNIHVDVNVHVKLFQKYQMECTNSLTATKRSMPIMSDSAIGFTRLCSWANCIGDSGVRVCGTAMASLN